MIQVDLYLELVPEMPCQRFGSKHAAVLAAGAAKVDHQAAEAPLDVIRHRDINDAENGI